MDQVFQYQEVSDFFSNNSFERKPVFRGESKFYPTCFSSIYREEKSDQDIFQGVLRNLCTHIFDNKILNVVTTKYEYVFLNDEQFGANDILNNEDLSVKHSIWGLEGLLQHYGFPTVWLDLTFDLETALFFASEKNDSEFGYLYYKDDYSSLWGTIIDVEKFAVDLRKIIPIPKSRPENQKALAFRASNLDFREDFQVIKFKKPNSETKKESKINSNFFPKDALETWFKGQIVDYYFDYLEREKRFLEENKPDNVAEYDWYRNGIEKVMTRFSLW